MGYLFLVMVRRLDEIGVVGSFASYHGDLEVR